jgi:glycosyltransferase involved in cell wall biosynthesis
MTQVAVVIISKNENSLAGTLQALQNLDTALSYEVVVVDASSDGMRDLRTVHPEVRWVSYESTGPKRVTIPEQRNLGVASTEADIVVYIDAGCLPQRGWLDRLVSPILEGRELVTVGRFTSVRPSPYDAITFTSGYVPEAPTLNMAFSRDAFTKVGGFDESFSYCSDTDFCWRLVDLGINILMVPDAEISVDWGGGRRQSRRAWYYGAGRARLYDKHRARVRSMLRHDPVLAIYPVFLLLLPITFVLPAYPLLLAVPLWRSRQLHPVRTVVDHLCYGAGALDYLVRRSR